jgi:vacuolar-type H+-ATPase subunit E/Vma4
MGAILGDVEALVAEILRHAHQCAVELDEQAKKQVSSILSQAQQETESVRARAEQETAEALKSLDRRSKAQGELEAHRRFASLREDPLDGVWAAAADRLRSLTSEPCYIEVLKHLAMTAARELARNNIVLAADPRGHELLTAERLKDWSAEAQVEFQRSPAPAPAWGGLLATSGRTRINATYSHRLALAKTVLREGVFDILTRQEP